MKKVLILLPTAGLIALFSFSSFSFAQTKDTQSAPANTDVLRNGDSARAKRLEQIQTANQNQQEKAASRQAQMQSKREEFKQRLQTVKDERKQKTLRHLVERLNHINARWTTHFTNVLNRLSEITAKLNARGADTSSAQTAIQTAQEAVSVQAQKEYIIDITSEENLRENFKAAKEQLKTDLRAVREQVQLARTAVREIYGRTNPADTIK